MNRIRVWDLPTRFFHWLLVISFIAAWLTEGNAQYLDFHVFAGYVFAGLLLFRILWGIVGSHYARFAQFVFGIKTVANYLRSLFSPHPTHFIGHNPAGSLAIFGILILGLIITVSGLFILGAQEQQGVLAGVIGFEYGEIFSEIHEISAWLLLGLVVIHIGGVIISSFLHHENLTHAMITGYKTIDTEGKSVDLYAVIAILLITGLLVSSGFYFRGYFTQTPDNPYLPFTGPPLASNEAWLIACKDCHLDYHPSLLPARSWQRLFKEQAEHFGDDLALDEDTVKELLTFSDRYAAETRVTKTAWEMSRTIPINEAPLRITETKYWKKRHREISEVIWQQTNISSRANCPACHLDAKQGTFRAGAMHIPPISQ
jgi:cytochrome b